MPVPQACLWLSQSITPESCILPPHLPQQGIPLLHMRPKLPLEVIEVMPVPFLQCVQLGAACLQLCQALLCSSQLCLKGICTGTLCSLCLLCLPQLVCELLQRGSVCVHWSPLHASASLQTPATQAGGTWCTVLGCPLQQLPSLPFQTILQAEIASVGVMLPAYASIWTELKHAAIRARCCGSPGCPRMMKREQHGGLLEWPPERI